MKRAYVTTHSLIMREAAACSRMKPKPMEKKMTKPEEVTVSDAETILACRMLGVPDFNARTVARMLAHIIAARVPDALEIDANTPEHPASRYRAFNECRDAVLRGKG